MPYAKHMFEETTRASLDQMISCWIGTRYDFQVSSGTNGEVFQKNICHISIGICTKRLIPMDIMKTSGI
uniref:aminoglycoside 6-adenylyltransferase n=1 Tax=unclassified Paenibacillus TaxID=185978 RepID=UPI00313BC783